MYVAYTYLHNTNINDEKYFLHSEFCGRYAQDASEEDDYKNTHVLTTLGIGTSRDTTVKKKKSPRNKLSTYQGRRI